MYSGTRVYVCVGGGGLAFLEALLVIRVGPTRNKLMRGTLFGGFEERCCRSVRDSEKLKRGSIFWWAVAPAMLAASQLISLPKRHE